MDDIGEIELEKQSCFRFDDEVEDSEVEEEGGVFENGFQSAAVEGQVWEVVFSGGVEGEMAKSTAGEVGRQSVSRERLGGRRRDEREWSVTRPTGARKQREERTKGQGTKK